MCGAAAGDAATLARHLVDEAEASDVAHVMWLNRHVTKERTDIAALTPLLARWAEGAAADAARVRR